MDKTTKPEHKPKSPQTHSAISAITMLTIKTAMHSRIIIWLLATIIGITTLLPFLLKGDGSPVGQMRIVITYPLTISFIVLALGTLWLSSGLISLEISGKEIQSIVTKPVRAFDIWLGKWLAMVAINTALITITSLGLLLSISITLNRYNDAAIQQQVLSARQAIQIEPIANIEWKAERMRQRLIKQNIIPDTTSTAKMCGELKAARSMVAPGKKISWTINLPPKYDQIPEIRGQKPETSRPVTIPPLPSSSFIVQSSAFYPISLRYKFRCNPVERTPISGTWIIESEENNIIQIPVHNILDGTHHLMLPDTFKPTGKTLKITFNNTPPPRTAVLQDDFLQNHSQPPSLPIRGTAKQSVVQPHQNQENTQYPTGNQEQKNKHQEPSNEQTSDQQTSPKNPALYFNPDTPAELLIHNSSFSMNLIRSMLALICFLSCIAAIGLTMSTLFSFPIAAFATSAIIFAITLASGFSEEKVDHHHGHEQETAKIIQLTEPALLFVKHATSNIVTNIPITSLANGMIFTWKQTAESIAVLLLLIPSILALLSSLLLSQKELAA